MAIVTSQRQASLNEIVAEMDRRGLVIQQLEELRDRLCDDIKTLRDDVEMEKRVHEEWRQRESETQEALQKLGEEFGVLGGEPRVAGLARVLEEMRTGLDALRQRCKWAEQRAEAAEKEVARLHSPPEPDRPFADRHCTRTTSAFSSRDRGGYRQARRRP